MKKILIPIDFNFNNYNAIDYAVNFFKRESCEFYFINTYSYEINGLDAIRFMQEDDAWFEKPKTDSIYSLGLLIQRYTCKNKFERHCFIAISEYGNLIDGIKETIKKLQIDLVLVAGKKCSEGKSCNYSPNTKRIIENVRDCPVMVIPESATMQKNPQFILASTFEVELSMLELENWFEFVTIARGSVNIKALGKKSKLTSVQNINQSRVLSQLEKLSKKVVAIEYLETAHDLKYFAGHNWDCIICLMDRKPDFWRKYGFSQSRITNFGPLTTTPLIALHR